MTQTKQQCSTPDQFLTFLRGQLSAREEADLQHHLDDCDACRERLERTAADASVWNEAREFFASGALHGSSKDSSEDHEEAAQGSQRIRQVLDSLGPTDDPESLGRIGGYEVTGVVGAGGMGVVLKAHDRSLDRIVAIKVMSPHLASSGSARKRFAREAKAAAAVLHPNVIAIHSVASEDANPYLVMPFVRGTSLQKRIDSQGPLPLKDTLRIGAQIAAGLAAAHDQGLVHRDIKPANILLEEGVERVTITDFGLARAVDDASMTCSGVIAGTPQYMSPEQARGEPIDARSDLFSLGGVLYAMCTGRSPFRAETTYGVLHRIANDKPTPVCEVNTDVPVWLGHVIGRLMAKRPEDRFESAAQVAELLEGCLAHVQQPAAIPLPDAVTALAPSKPRRPPIVIGKLIAAAAFVFASIFAGVFVVLELDKGTLTIQSEVDDIRVRITRGKDVVNELKVTQTGQSIRVAAGQYNVEVIGETDGLAVENGQVTLHRSDTEVVKIIHNTHDTHDNNVPGYNDLSSFNDSNAAIQTNQSNSSDSLSESIDKFNEYLNRNPQNDQPILTRDELIACASWNIERNHELTETQYVALSKIAKQHQFPEGWRIDGSYLMLPPHTTPVRAYRISLVHSVTGEVFTVRERFVEPSLATKPTLRADHLGGTQLKAAITRFNARHNQANGYKQPPLTENEVVAAILHHQTKRDEADVSDALFEKFQTIARECYLPEGASLEVIPTFGIEGGSTYTIWSVRIRMFQDEPGKEGWTYAFEIREQFVSVKHGDAGEIHWGQPAENGLQAGVRLSPALLSCELGQKIDVQILYRNILGRPISAGVPNFGGYGLTVHDANGTPIEIFDLHEPLVVGGARSEQIGDEPVSSRGRSLAFAPKSMTKDALTEYRSKTGASILILVDPGKSYRLQFEVSNVADATDGTLKTGGVEIAVEKAQKHSTTHESVRKNGKGKIIVGEEAGPNVAQPALLHTDQVIDALVTFEFNGVVGNATLNTPGIGWVVDQRGHILVPSEMAPRSEDYSIEVRYADGLRTSAKRVFTFGHLALLKPEKAPAIAPIKLNSQQAVQDGDQVLAILNGTDVQKGTVTSARKTIVSLDSWPILYSPRLRFPNAIETDFKSDPATLFGAPMLTPSGEVVGMLLNYAPPMFAIPLSEIQIACREFEASHTQSAVNSAEAIVAPEEAGDEHSEIVPGTIDSERATNAVKCVMQYLMAVKEKDSETINTVAKGLAKNANRENEIAKLVIGGDIPKHYKTWFVNHSAVVALGPLSTSDKQMNGRFLLFKLSLVDEQWSIVDIDLEVEEKLLERFRVFPGTAIAPANSDVTSVNSAATADQAATADEAYQAMEKLLANPKMNGTSTERYIETAASRMTSNIEFAKYVLDRFRIACEGGESNYLARRHSLAVLTRAFHAWGQSRWSPDPASIEQHAKPSETWPQEIRDFELSSLESVVSYGLKATRSDIVDFVLAARALHHPNAKPFLQAVMLNPQSLNSSPYATPAPVATPSKQSTWSDNIGGTWPDARFVAAVGLAELGDPSAIDWLLDKAEPKDFGFESIYLASHERDRSGSLRESSRCALIDLFGHPKDLTATQLSDWWKLNRAVVTRRMVRLKSDFATKIETLQERILANARIVVEAYVASAISGHVAQASDLAKNSPADPKRIQELPEFLNVQRLKIETVYINDPAKPTQALATSEAVKLEEEHKNPDGRRDGFMVFTLELTDERWFVIDIDFETKSGAEKKLKKFLEANPNSIGIPPQS